MRKTKEVVYLAYTFLTNINLLLWSVPDPAIYSSATRFSPFGFSGQFQTHTSIQSSHNTPCISRAKIKAFVGPYFSLEDNQITVANSITNATAQINETVPKVIIIITLLIIHHVLFAQKEKGMLIPRFSI